MAGGCTKEGMRALAALFADSVKEVLFGLDAPDPYARRYATTGLLRVKADVLHRGIDELKLPLCNTQSGRASSRSS
jgi:hypothetical protein